MLSGGQQPSPPGQQLAYRAVLTAPDGSQHKGVASVDGVTRRSDQTPTFRVSFTEIADG
jgi:hypothetical protein